MGTILTSFIHLAHLWALFGYGLNVLWSGSEYLLFALQAVWVLKTQIKDHALYVDIVIRLCQLYIKKKKKKKKLAILSKKTSIYSHFLYNPI